ncbi:glycosyltransferase family 61 protein [Actinidia rufa]|uniref:Glycosyltransferase family 61 protein n=1 Tax=Actinidia rufa TaxID=165716 RepID=A0A7J0GJ81_9ERIC|nr:glycosyltransferase family 61 protein [Actinidia rufa]
MNNNFSAGPHGASPLASPISCDRSHQNYDICSINGPTVLDPTQSTFYVVGPTSPTPLVEKVRPYPQKNSSFTIERVKEVTLTSGPPGPLCRVQHKAPALVFSGGGFMYNFFHTFIDGFIPLFITINSVSPDDQDFVFVIVDHQDWWVRKYIDFLRSYSKHPIINLDNDTSTHCFPSATVGLISHGFMTIDPKLMPNPKAPFHFHSLLEKTYCHPHTLPISATVKYRPRLVIMSRSGGGGRVILNQPEVRKAAEEEGFEVIEFEPGNRTPLQQGCELISSSEVMLGVHGAALTYMWFLRPPSVLIQVVGIGLEKVAELCFGAAARDMGLDYMEYRIGLEESSLVDRYGKDDVIVKDPNSLQFEWYDQIMEVFLKKQNVNLNMVRFRKYLKIAYQKAKIAMVKEG